MVRQESIAQLQKLFHSYEGMEFSQVLTKLQKDYGLFILNHDTEPLSIMSYGRSYGKGNTPINVCRGLVIEHQTWKIVSRGFDRFFAPDNPSPKTQINLKRATVKEDGSLIFMFKYGNNWHLSTMHNFADGKLPFKPTQTYQGLFTEIIGQSLNDFAQSLLKQLPNGSDVMTLCFEMCSLHNRVVRKYETPTLFLLAIFGDSTGSTEISVPRDLILPQNVQVVTEIDFPSQLTIADLSNRVRDLSQSDPTFEGLVIQTEPELMLKQAGPRIKVKNPYYLIHHRLKYRGWAAATPQLLVPMILDSAPDMYPIIMKNLIDSIGQDDEVQFEINQRYEHYKSQILAFDAIYNEIPQIAIAGKKVGYLKWVTTTFPNINKKHSRLFSKIWKLMQSSGGSFDLNQVKNLINYYIHSNMEAIFTDPIIQVNHSCDFDLDQLQSSNDGLAKDADSCHCSQPMKLVRLGRDLSRYRLCACGQARGLYTYSSGTLLLVCCDAECLCTHEVNQKTGQALGLPASILCKNLRLDVHEMINDQMKIHGWTRNQCYDRIAHILDIDKSKAHMAQMGMQSCIKIIKTQL
jgi:hypothetical protein